MTEQQIVIAALSRFSDWAEPGTYIPRVLAEPSLDEVSKRVVSEIWEEANDPKYWVEPSFNSAPELLRQGLRTSYLGSILAPLRT
jgi:hypothetical protein